MDYELQMDFTTIDYETPPWLSISGLEYFPKN